jgi:fatty acid desaturase
MRLFRHSADILPTFIIVGLCCADLILFFIVKNPWILVGWLLLMVLPKSCICSWNHHHQHVATFRSKYLNRALEVVYALHTGICTNAWVLHHNLGHHLNYLDQKLDQSAWQDKKGRRMGTWRYTFTIAMTGYWRAYLVGREHRKFQRGFLTGGVLVILLLALLCYINWVNAVLLFVVPMVGGLLVTSWHTYYHHSGLPTEDHFGASHNITHALYNLCTGNLGFHTAHHLKPGLHWSKLPEFHATIAAKIPAHLFVKPCLPFCWLPG